MSDIEKPKSKKLLKPVNVQIKEMFTNAFHGDLDGEGLDHYDLEQWNSAFPLNLKNFLIEDALNARLEAMEAQLVSEMAKIMSQTLITPIALPADFNGIKFTHADFDGDINKKYPYFHLVFSKMDDPTGLASIQGLSTRIPLLKILPVEIIEQCSVIVNYPPKVITDPIVAFEHVKSELKKKVSALQRLTLGYNKLN